MQRRRFHHFFSAALVALMPLTVSLPQAAHAAGGFPAKPIRIVVPNAAGGAADLTARAVGEHMAKTLGQPVIVDNKPGAGGVVAGQAALQAAPDGHTLLLISSGTAVSQALFKSLPFDAARDFIPVAPLATLDLVIVTSPQSGFAKLGDLLAWAKANAGKLNIGTPMPGTTQNLAAEWFKIAAGIDAAVVPYKSTPEVITAVRGQQIRSGLDILGPLLPQIQSGALKPLAVTGARRSRVLPDVPTAQEAGVKGLDATSWNGLAVPKGTPPEAVQALNAAVNAALKDPAVRQRLESLNLDPHPGTPQDAATMLHGDIKRWTEVIAKAGIEKL